MTEPMTRHDALALLELGAEAGVEDVKRAYRRLARRLHPDAGGDPDAFRDLQRAYERLVSSPPVERARRRAPQRSRPSRQTRGGHAPTQLYSDEVVTLDEVDWDDQTPTTGMVRLDLDVLARALARPHAGPVHPVTARSRGPRALANRWLHLLADDLTATLVVRPAQERGRRGHDVELWLRVWSRRERRLLEAADLPSAWILTRGSSATTATRTLAPSHDRRTTAVRAARSVDTALERVGWPLSSWSSAGADLT